MEGINEYKERNNGILLTNIKVIPRLTKNELANARTAYNRGYSTYKPYIQRNMTNIMSKEANTAASRAESALKTTGRWTNKNGTRAAADARVRYWNSKTPLGSPQWKRNALQKSKNEQAALTPQKSWLPWGGKHRKTHKRHTNKRRHTKRNRN